MTDIDSVLNALENRTRREIIKRLIFGEGYPLQLSKELKISQQAIMKHLYILEKNNIVRFKGTEKSDLGPNRKIYSLEDSFMLIVSLAPYFFDIKKKNINFHENIEIKNGNLIEELKKVENEIEDLENKLIEKMKLKNAIMEKIDEIISDQFKSSLEREIFYAYLSTWDENYVSDEIGLPPNIVRGIVERIINEYI
ncbi:MAG: ArsR/SmtB family transcription factor [Thermoplasmata archaeon]|nr:ArsR family transcriptional regulator [Thermoplasmata archaeon]